jgi:AraC-like DNA-binding protein
MKGFEEDWTPLPSGEHSVRYTSLPHGDYTFEVTYASALDNAQGATISIDVHVKPYFWKSWWFRLLVAIALVAALSYLLRQMQRRRQRQLELAKQQEAERLMRPIEKVLRESEDPQQLQQRIQSILNDQKRYSESSKKSVEADAEERMKNTKPFMERVMSIMEQNYMNSEFDVTEFCQQIGMSRSLLSRKLNEHTGQSTSQFIRNYRLDIARQILKRGDQRNIAEIAFSVGFNDPKYFTRCFSKLYGVSPSSMIE